LTEYDLVVVGGGPSGASAAVAAAKKGLRVVLIEKGGHDRFKPCGGLLPKIAAENIAEVFGKPIPRHVFNTLSEVRLFYSPPSGPLNGGEIKNYRLLNIVRSSLDEWLREQAETAGVEVLYDSTLLCIEDENSVSCRVRRGGSQTKLTCRYLVGADGVFSTVRRGLGKVTRTLGVIQETWEAEGVGDMFLMLLDGRLSDTYSYMIPKGDRIEVGLGTRSDPSGRMHELRKVLAEQFGVEFGRMQRRDGWAIPNGSVFKGGGRVILVGDAAGFCNPLSGEGIRLGVESGDAAGYAVAEAIDKGGDAFTLYSRYVSQIERLVESVYAFSSGMTDEQREKFVSDELKRVSLT
jgi:geranylgeranyl reductase